MRQFEVGRNEGIRGFYSGAVSNPILVCSVGAKKFHRLVQSDYPNVRTRSSGTVVSQLTIPS
jgi:hypothetical protein